MTVQTSNKLSPATKSSKNIDLLKEPILLRFGIEHDDLSSELSNAVKILGFEGVKDEAAIFSDATGGKTEAFEAPLCILAVLLNPAHRGREKRLLDWLKGRGIIEEPVILEWRTGKEMETAGVLI